MANIRRMFPGGNTSNGFYSFHDNIIGLDRKMLYILKGMPGGGKSSLMKEIGENALKKGYSIEYHHCPSDPNSIDGVVINDLGIGIIDGTAPHIVDPYMPGLLDEIVDLGKYIDKSKIDNNRDEILKAKRENKSSYRSAYSFFRAGREILNEIVEGNKERMEFGKINEITYQIIEEIFNGKKTYPRLGNTRHLFNRALTPEGLIDYTHTLVDGSHYIYYLKGEYGTGKSTLLKRICEEAVLRGYDVEVFHQPLIPEKINCIVLPQLSISFISDKLNNSAEETIINLDKCLDSKLDLEDNKNIFHNLIERGIGYLKNAKEKHDALEKYYHIAIDFDGIQKEKEILIEKINNL